MNKEIKDSGVEWIGKIPENWEVISVKRLYQNLKEIIGDQENKFDRLALTLNGVIKRSKDDGEGLQPEKFETYQIVYKNELIFKLIDLENVSTSRVGYSNYTGIVSPVYIRLINDAESEYGYYYFTNMWYQEVFNVLGSGVRSNLTAKNLLNVPYLKVPKSERDFLTKKLDDTTKILNELVQQNQQSITELKKYKQSIITEVVTKGLDSNIEMNDSGIEVIGNINSNFEIIPLGYLGQLQNGISKSGDYFGTGFPFISYSDVYKNRILPKNVQGLVMSTEKEQKDYSIQEGDVLFTRTSEVIEEVGMASVCLSTIPAVTFAGFLIRFRPFVKTKLLTEYARYYFDALFIRDFFAKEMNLVTRASLSQPLLKRLPVILPSIDEQEQIISYLDNQTARIDKLIEDKTKVIEELENYKKSLIYEYVTGKREV